MSAARDGAPAHTVLLTGASGVVGRSILHEPPRPSIRIIALARGGPDAVPEGAHRVVTGDLTEERFGLDPDAYARLAREVDTVIHSAGLTEWGLPAERYEPVNIAGTRRVIAFAEQAGATVHFMSTAFVAAFLDTPKPPGTPPPGDANVTVNYVRSKLRGEQMLRASGLPHTIFRPTNLIGDAATGWTSRPQIVQLLSDWICRGRAPFVPLHHGNRIDIVPQDLLSKAVLRAVELGDTDGAYWVTYGDEAMAMDAAVEVCAKHAAARGRPIDPPRIVDPETVDADALARMPKMTRAYVSVLRDVSEITRGSGGVLPTSLPAMRARLCVPDVPDTVAYQRTLEYASAHLT